LDEVGSDLEAMDRGETPPERGAFVPKPKEKPEEKADDALPQDVVPPEKPKDKPKSADAQPAPEAQTLKLPELRKAYDGLKKRVASELEPEVTRLRSQVAELEKRAPVDTKPFEEKVTAAEKRIADQEAVIRFLDYQQSAEFQEKYSKPYAEAWQKALGDLAEFEVEQADGTTRKPSENDLISLAGMSLGEARKRANAMFGDSADDVMWHVREVRRLADAQHNALQQAKTNAAKMAEDNKTRSVESAKARNAAWQTQNQSLAEKYPKWFAPDAEDSEGSALLKKGFAIADLVFAAGSPIDEATKQLLPKSFVADLEANKGRLSPEAQIRLHTLIRNKAAGFDRLARQVKSLSTQLEEANQKLAAYEETEPPTGGDSPTGGGVVGDYLEDSNAELDKLDKLSR
jgi:hypothetical protein